MRIWSCFPHWQRLLVWSIVGLFLVGIGAVLYVALPPGPRWSVTGPMRTLLTEDGPAVATHIAQGDQKPRGPIEFWDMETGEVQQRLLADGSAFLACASSHAGRTFVAIVPGTGPDVQSIARIDLNERTECRVEAALGKFDSALFSRQCDYVAVRQRKLGVAVATYTLADTATGRICARFAVPCRPPARTDDLMGGWADSVDDGKFTDDGRFLVVNHIEGPSAAASIVETWTGKTTVLAESYVRALAPDSHCLIALRKGTSWIWDLAAMDWRAPLEAAAPDMLHFSADGHWLASVQPKQTERVPVRFFDLHTGRLHWQFESITTNSEGVQEETFAPDGRHFVMPTEPAPGQRRITMYDVPGKRELWQRTWPANYGSCLFTADSRTFIAALPTKVVVADSATGDARFTVDIPQSVALDPGISRDGRTLYLQRQPGPGEPTLWTELLEEYWPWPLHDIEHELFPLYAYDLATGQELWQLQTHYAAQLCFGRDCVLTVHPHEHGREAHACTIECWDIPPRKRLGWIIGTPVGLGATVLLGRAGWRRLRRRKAKPRPCV
jgi:hypothetical protein